MNVTWFARSVLFVADIDRALDFYVNRLGFSQSWRFEENGRARVAQAERQSCALIFSAQWPDKVGKGLMFISLDDDRAVDALRAELIGRGVEVQDRIWGYKVLVVRDPDGNELYFNYSNPG
jgi:catechol 2,3-dioxygenase-like lactoylglutathione lyase family enzyme